MKKLLIVMFILMVALPLNGAQTFGISVGVVISIKEGGLIELRSDIRNVNAYDPDPEGFLRHDGRYAVARADTTSKGKIRMKNWNLYFFPNGNFLIHSESTKNYTSLNPKAKYGFYKVVDSTLVKVNMYSLTNENKVWSMHTDYYRIVNDSTVQPIVHVDFKGRNGESEDRDLYRFERDTLPRFENPILRYKWMHTSETQKAEGQP